MKSHVPGQTTVAAVAPNLHLGTYRRNIMAVVADDTLFTPAEQLRANHSVYECQDVARLALWLKNVRRVAGEREEAQALALMAQGIARFEATLQAAQQPTTAPAPEALQWATSTQCDEIFRLACLPCFTAGEKASALRGLVTLTQPGAIKEIGQLYATAWRRGTLPLYSDGATRLAA